MENEVSKRTLIIISIVTGITIFLVFIISVTTVSNEGCVIDINEDITDLHPLLLQQNTNKFLLPNNDSKIILSGGESLQLACPGQNNYISVDGAALLTLTCVYNKKFHVNYVPYFLKDLKCRNYAEPSVQISNTKCAEKYTQTEIGFNTSAGFVPLITTCFDDVTKDSLFSVHNLSSKINNRQATNDRPNFIQDNFYSNLQLNNLYTIASEKKVFQEILGKSVEKYISKNNYLNRGHLAPNADFIYRPQRHATFFYMNIAPQWQKFNGGNWNDLERSCRDFIIDRNLDLIVYTGTFGTATLPNKKGISQGLSLYLDAKKNKILTVPKLFWKLLYDPISKSGVVFIGHNNPYEVKIKKLCIDVCDQIKWISWQATDIQLGLSYCCEYTTAKNIIKHLPDIPIVKLLT